eukprot:UN34233
MKQTMNPELLKNYESQAKIFTINTELAKEYRNDAPEEENTPQEEKTPMIKDSNEIECVEINEVNMSDIPRESFTKSSEFMDGSADGDDGTSND